MFGIKPGALSDASLSDKLSALGSALSGDMEGVQAIRDRREREKLASILAAELDKGRTLPQAQPEPEPVRAPRVDPMGQASADVLSRLQNSGGLMQAQQVAAPAIDPVSVQLPKADPQQRGLFDRMLPMLVQAAGHGVDINGLTSLIRNEDYVRGLPQRDQSAARVDPQGAIADARERAKPNIQRGNPGDRFFDIRDGAATEIAAIPERAVRPSMDTLTAEAYGRYQRGQATPEDNRLITRWEAGSDGFYRERAPQREAKPPSPRQAVEAKIAAGQSLTAGEQQLWDATHRQPTGSSGGGAYGDDETVSPVAPPKPTPPSKPNPALPKKPAPAAPAAPRVQAGPVRVKSAAEARALKPGTVFITPDGRRKVR